jgi:hypothetical protein
MRWASATQESNLPPTYFEYRSPLELSTNMEPDKSTQRGPPNKLNLPDMFREIARSLNRAFQRFCDSLARRRRGMCSLSMRPRL